MSTTPDHLHPVGGGIPVYRRMLASKIHRATVTHADLEYEGSLTIDEELMAMAAIVDFEEVHIWSITRGTRLTTYAIKGKPGSGVICANGAAAHLIRPNDLVIIATFLLLPDEITHQHHPAVVFVDGHNRPVALPAHEVPGPDRRVQAAYSHLPLACPHSPRCRPGQGECPGLGSTRGHSPIRTILHAKEREGG